MPPEAPEFAAWLISTGRALGYTTNTALAKAIGVPQPTVSRWKGGSKPSVEHLVKISELFGVELKTLLVLAGYMQGDVGKALRPPRSQGDRIIDEMSAPQAYKEDLRAFWQQREAEELDRLRVLAEGLDNAVAITGVGDSKSMEPWLEDAMRTNLPQHVQALRRAVAAPASVTWILQVHPAHGSDPNQVLEEAMEQAVEVTQQIVEDEEGYSPSMHGVPPTWMLLGPTFETPEEAEAALAALRRAYPTFHPGEVEYHSASEA